MAGRRIEGNFSQGWGVAAFITLLAAAGFATAFMINQRTYHSPNDVTAPSSGATEPGHAPASGPVKH
jgi:hypothetical protein